jgi:hypothetical protein
MSDFNNLAKNTLLRKDMKLGLPLFVHRNQEFVKDH